MPFNEVYFTIIRDSDGRKMSKSLVIRLTTEPIAKYGLMHRGTESYIAPRARISVLQERIERTISVINYNACLFRQCLARPGQFDY